MASANQALSQDGTDREMGHQSFWEAILLSKMAATQWT
jgi:hypothetical protein